MVGLIARQGAAQLAMGLGIGLTLAFGVVFGSIIIVGMAVAVFPARRAASVDPVEALRYD